MSAPEPCTVKTPLDWLQSPAAPTAPISELDQATPLPERGAEDPAATVSVALFAPVLVGVKLTVTEHVPPATSVPHVFAAIVNRPTSGPVSVGASTALLLDAFCTVNVI